MVRVGLELFVLAIVMFHAIRKTHETNTWFPIYSERFELMIREKTSACHNLEAIVASSILTLSAIYQTGVACIEKIYSSKSSQLSWKGRNSLNTKIIIIGITKNPPVLSSCVR